MWDDLQILWENVADGYSLPFLSVFSNRIQVDAAAAKGV
jgi:hypothetical protein